MQNDTNKKRGKFQVKLRQSKPKRMDWQYIFREITDVVFAKNGLLYTIKKMLISPGKSVRHYLEEDRKPFVRPIVFVIITSLIFAFVDFFFPAFGGLRASYPNSTFFINPFFISGFSTASAVLIWIAEASAYTTLLLGLFVALAAKLFFRKSGYNFVEIFVLLCYVCGIAMLFLSVGAIIPHFFDFNIYTIRISERIAIIYLVWAVGQFFDKEQGWTKRNIIKKGWIYIRAFLSYYIGAVVYVTFVLFIPILIYEYATMSNMLPIIISFALRLGGLL